MVHESAFSDARRPARALAILLALAGATAAVACQPAAPDKGGFALENDDDDKDGKDDKPKGEAIDGTPQLSETTSVPTATPGAYAHSKDTLYALDTAAKKATAVGKFTCVPADDAVIDIAVNAEGAIYATTFTRFLKVNPKDGSCSIVGEIGPASNFEKYPNSLSFVPAGVLDPQKEVLVGYVFHALEELQDTYVQIDPANGAMKYVGELNPPLGSTRYESSGDLVVLQKDANKAYLTVRSTMGGNDFLAEVDPRIGTITRVIGDTKQTHLYGLAYWTGTAYAFSDTGNAFAIDVTNAATTPISFEGGAGAVWYGAGVTTIAPK